MSESTFGAAAITTASAVFPTSPEGWGESGENFGESSLAMPANHASIAARVLLEKYHGVATRQANKLFVSALIAMAVGLLVLVGAFVASMQFNALGERLFIGSLAALATAFVGYLSKTFLVVYDRSLQQLNQYFNQPVLNGYFLTAERIVERLDDPKKQELTAQIVMDVLETGKEMHQLSVARASEPKPRPRVTRQRRPQADQAAQP